MNEQQNSVLDEQLQTALRSTLKPDFDAWRANHSDAIAHLNPVVYTMHRRRRRLIFKLVSSAAAAVVVGAGLLWLLGSQQPSFAETVKAITEAKSITWTMTRYMRYSSRDGKQNWLKSHSSKFAYMQPGLVRQTEYDEKGNESSVTIVDTRTGKFLVLNLKEKKTDPRLRLQFGPVPADGPFGYIAEFLRTKPVEFVGQRKVNGRKVNVFRYRREKMPVKENTFDMWIDAETKQYVGGCDPSSDLFDPETAPERNNPPGKNFGEASIVGSVTHDIEYNAKLDPRLFSLVPPAGFQVVEPPKLPAVTEQQMVEWLGLMARVNDNIFIDQPLAPFYNERIKGAFNKGNHSELEKQLRKDFNEYLKSRHYPPSMHFPPQDFVKEETVPDSFKYVGKGVKLGTADRIICWYKLKSTGKLRAVYGDLKVKDVTPAELPLPIEK
jgi:outer membrane lipoprotein-sorting protein